MARRGEPPQVREHLGVDERIVERQVADIERAQPLAVHLPATLDRNAATIRSAFACSV